MRIKRYCRFLVCLMLTVVAPLAADEITECDLRAGHSSDPHHVGPGVSSSEMILQKAIPACREAVAANPESPRAQYQLGRSLVYWGDANGVDVSEGLQHIEISAGKDYMQALFVLGLMYRREDRNCETELLYRKAADQGLKAGRLAYVDDVVSGYYKGCVLGADKATMEAYLEAASSQVKGYYEEMLLAALKRELRSWQP